MLSDSAFPPTDDCILIIPDPTRGSGPQRSAALQGAGCSTYREPSPSPTPSQSPAERAKTPGASAPAKHSATWRRSSMPSPTGSSTPT